MNSDALKVENYLLDNAKLPEGTTAVFTNSAKTVVELRLLSTFVVVEDGLFKVEVLKTLQDVNGAYVVATTDSVTKLADATNKVSDVTLKDNVAPTLVSAKYVVTEGSDVPTQINFL